MFSRRQILRSSAAFTAYLALSRNQFLHALPSSDPLMAKMGLQLWTVRNQMKSDPSGTLKAIQEAGYFQVELGDLMDADSLVPLAKEHQLRVTSSFIPWNSLAEANAKNVPTIPEMIEKANQHGIKHLVFGYVGKGFRETADQYKAMADRSNKAAHECLAAGIQLCYHNHSFEYAKLDNGQSGFEIFMERFDKQMMFELDVFWAAIGGWNPIETMEKLDGRISQLHLKDLKADTGTIYDEGKVPADAFLEVGNGVINMAAVIQTARKIGVQQCHVEQDQSPAPLASIATSFAYLKKLDA